MESSLEALRFECPRAYEAMVDALARAIVRVRIDGEEFSLVCRRGALFVTSAMPNACVDVVTDRSTIVDVVEARTTLLDGVHADRLMLRGQPEAIAAFHDALMMYVAGALRAPTFPPLLDSFANRAEISDIPGGRSLP